jgi:hypothetical protein
MVEQHQHTMQLNSKSWNYTPSCRLFCIAIEGSLFSSSGQSFRSQNENTKFCRLSWLCYYIARDKIIETEVRMFLSSAYSDVKHICMYIHTYIHIRVYIYIHVYIHSLNILTCIHPYIYMYIFVHHTKFIHMYIHTHTYLLTYFTY